MITPQMLRDAKEYVAMKIRQEKYKDFLKKYPESIRIVKLNLTAKYLNEVQNEQS